MARSSVEQSIIRRPPPARGDVVDHVEFEDDPDAPQAADIERLSEVTQKCPECGKDLFDDAEVCWNCGCAVSEARSRMSRPPWWVMLAGVAALVGFLLYAL
jgi:uncharacterized protein (DUF983 family)